MTIKGRVRRRSISSMAGIVGLWLLTAGPASAGPGADSAGAYPPSTLLPGFDLDWSTLRREAPGSDNWPITWADNGQLYTAWGDGGGFTRGGGRGRRVSLGYARLRGDSAATIQGENLPGFLRGVEGKSYSLLALGDALYTFVSPGSTVRSYEEARLYRQPLGGGAARRADWAFLGAGPDRLLQPTFLQAGRGYRDVGGDVYAYATRFAPTRSGDLSIQRGRGRGEVALLRAGRGSDLLDRDSWSFFAGRGPGGEPTWTRNAGELEPAVTDRRGVGWVGSATYVKALDRYVLTTQYGAHAKGRAALVEGPTPWGPWRTVASRRIDDPQGRTERLFYYNFVPNSFSEDGKSFTLAFTGRGRSDALLLADGRFTGTAREADADRRRALRAREEADAAAGAAADRVLTADLQRRAAQLQGLELADRTQARRERELEEGLAAGLAALPDAERLGLTALPIGSRALPAVAEETVERDATRAQFTRTFSPDAHDGGFALNYGLGGGTALGVAITRYDDAGEEPGSDTARTSMASDGVSVYLRHDVRALAFDTRLSHGRDRFEQGNPDDAAGEIAFDGRTTALSQRVGYRMGRGRLLLTPWAELGRETRQLDEVTLTSSILPDQTYSAAEVSDTLASLGLDARLDPVSLGEGRRLTLRGGLSYTHGLAQDDYRLRADGSGSGSGREETVDRPAARTLGLTFGGSLTLGEQLSLDAGLSLDSDRAAGSDQAGRIAVSWRF